jgi:uncharacterized protein
MLGRSVIAVFFAASLALAQQPRRIIDMHMHAEPNDAPYGSTMTSPLTGRHIKAAAGPAALLRETLAHMRKHNIVKAMLSAEKHDSVLRWRAAAPERFLIGYEIDDPAGVDWAWLRQEHAAGRLDVIGEVATQYAGIPPNDSRMEPIYALAEELDVPVALHMHPGPWGATYPPFHYTKMRPSNGNPLLLEDVLARHPKLRLYVMHAGWPFLEAMIAMLYAHPQLYVDVGVIDWTQAPAEFHRYLRGLVQAGYGKRVLFGSDQMVWPDAIDIAVANVESADYLTRQQKDDIFYYNAARFLRLESGVPAARKPAPPARR